MDHDSLPVIVVGGGPVGLAAAAHLLARNLTPLVFEAGPEVGAGIRRWGHVRMFSPWRSNVDGSASALLSRDGWLEPDPAGYPTGNDLVDRYLAPLAATRELAGRIRLNTRVVAIARQDHDLMKGGSRSDRPFVVRIEGPAGDEDVLGQAVIDASGTIDRPGPLGASGFAAIGERAAIDRIFYGIPDVLGRLRHRYVGRRVLVVGSGHSALNAVIDLAALAEAEPPTRILWAIRRTSPGRLFGGAVNDQLAERGKLGSEARTLLDTGRVELLTDFHIDRITRSVDGIVVGSGNRAAPPVDEIVAATGFRPDWSMLSELRLDLDPAVQSPRALAPLIDPNVHSCGTVRPHGAEELKQPETNLFPVGMKSYGRAPTFLLMTGYEQVRSVVAAIAGDWEAARRVELVLPETGVCSTAAQSPAAGSVCCGTSSAEAVPITIGPLATTRGDVSSVAAPVPQTSCCS